MAFSCYVSGSFKLSWFGCSKLLLRPIEWSKATDLLYLIYCYAFSFTSSLLYDIESSHSYMVLLQNQPSCLPVSWADQYFMISICWAVAVSYIFMVLLTTNEVDKNIPSNFFLKNPSNWTCWLVILCFHVTHLPFIAIGTFMIFVRWSNWCMHSSVSNIFMFLLATDEILKNCPENWICG